MIVTIVMKSDARDGSNASAVRVRIVMLVTMAMIIIVTASGPGRRVPQHESRAHHVQPSPEAGLVSGAVVVGVVVTAVAVAVAFTLHCK
jgi:multisubunit Na+/H+ antiporter MnhC subunit